MGHWNYRVCSETYNKGEPHEEVGYTIREVYYTSAGNIWGTTTGDKGVYGSDLNEITDGLAKMQQALTRPVLNLDTLEFSNIDGDHSEMDITDASEASSLGSIPGGRTKE